ncbi:histidine phosphatase family protein [Sneathiella glossodoripedis]|uniref:histidine phosphatase family protein n=1 Tax=Sneathiella glossodoripedis TaxID=418853 RepID=UPI00046FC6C7|nr:histidine phosphatase family protein [Sneathiella glossodoripedis]
MVDLYFVRHGEASSSWEASTDPGLSALGHRQSKSVSEEISALEQRIKLYSSPLLRAQETADPLVRKWGVPLEIEPAIAEIPSGGISLENRRQWLSTLMTQSWSEQPQNLLDWRAGILGVMERQTSSAVFFTHFMVLNVIVGALTKTEKIVSFRPDNCAITIVRLTKEGPILLEKGREATTVVR